MNRDGLKKLVTGIYDLQEVRKQTGGRLVSQFRAKLGLAPSEKLDEESNASQIISELKTEWHRYTDGVGDKLPKSKFKREDGLIDDYIELAMCDLYFRFVSEEAKHIRRLLAILEDFPIWTEFLRGVRGIGPVMAGVLISGFDIHRARYVSTLYKYSGLHVIRSKEGYRAQRKRKEDLIEMEYVDAKGKTQTKMGLGYNPWLRAKIIGVMGPLFLKHQSPYANIYYALKHREETNPKLKDLTKLHRHNRAIRYMMKIFLADLYTKWRTLENLPVHPTYHEEKHLCVHGEYKRPDPEALSELVAKPIAV